MSPASSNHFQLTGEKNHVARKACLSCREKKIKCDGEVQFLYGDDLISPSNTTINTTFSYKNCTNCITSGIQCIFVPSRRGGRRKKRDFSIAHTSKDDATLPKTNNPSYQSDSSGPSLIPTHFQSQDQSKNSSIEIDQAKGVTRSVHSDHSDGDNKKTNNNDHSHFKFHHGPPHHGPPHYGSPHYGQSHHGPPHHCPPHHGLPHHCHPHHGPPHHGPPHNCPPHHGPPHHGPPHYCPPHYEPPHNPFIPPPLPGYYTVPSKDQPLFHYDKEQEISYRYRNYEYTVYSTPQIQIPYHRSDVNSSVITGHANVKPTFSTLDNINLNENSVDKAHSGNSNIFMDDSDSGIQNGSVITPSDSVTMIVAGKRKSSNISKFSKEQYDTRQGHLEFSSEFLSTEKWIREQREVADFEKTIKKLKISSVPTKLDISINDYISEDVLKKIGFPDYQTIYKVVGVFYKYVHTDFLVLPNMETFMKYFRIQEDFLCLLSAIFRTTTKYMKNYEISDSKWLDNSYWDGMINFYKKNITSQNFYILSTILEYSLSDDEIKTAIKILLFSKEFESEKFKPTSEMHKLIHLASDCKILSQEMHIRATWNIYKSQIFKRVRVGYPYKKENTENYSNFEYDIELPLPDRQYYQAAYNDTTFKDSFRRTLELSEINTINPDASKLYDSACLITSLRIMEEILNYIADGSLTEKIVLKFSKVLYKMYELHKNFKHLQPYQLETHPIKNPHIVMNLSNLYSSFLNRSSMLALSIGLSLPFYLYKPKMSGSNFSSVNLFDEQMKDINDPIEILNASDLMSVEDRLLSWKWFLEGADASLELIRLLELGDGVCPANLSSMEPIEEVFETVMGPCCFGEATVENWCKFNTWTKGVSTVRQSNQGWIQMPQSFVLFAIQAWCSLASLRAALEVIEIEILSTRKDDEDPSLFNHNKIKSANTLNRSDKVEFSDNEDQNKCQLTKDAGRISKNSDFKSINKTKINIRRRGTKELVSSEIELNRSGVVWLLQRGELKMHASLMENLKIIRKYFGVLETFNRDCRVAGMHCDHMLKQWSSRTNMV
ncbi:hypothetical protein DAMA08_036640 [Martiniozyma asiatica (nom. inval.)]|nr:hypothetical protein DAMA08_036640 [Martiniozyma asiatica]